jgi:hypothetical protein
VRIVREVTWLDIAGVTLSILIFFVPIVANFAYPDSAFVHRFLKNAGAVTYYVIAYGALFWLERKMTRAGIPRRSSFWKRPVHRKAR